MKGTIWSQNWKKSEAEDRQSSNEKWKYLHGHENSRDYAGVRAYITDMKQIKMQEKLFCSLLPSK